MTKYLRLSRRAMSQLWQEAISKGMVFESPNSVLRAMLLRGIKPKAEPEEVQVRIDDEVWDKIISEAMEAGKDTRHLSTRDKEELLWRLIDKYGESHKRTLTGPDERPRTRRR